MTEGYLEVLGKRKRALWSAAETAALVAGVARFGVGKWSSILTEDRVSGACVLAGRSGVDCKDRYRNLQGGPAAARGGRGEEGRRRTCQAASGCRGTGPGAAPGRPRRSRPS